MKVNSNKSQSMQDILKQLEDGVQAVFTSENYTSFLRMMAQFRNSLSVIEKTARELISWLASYGLTLEAAV